MVIMARAAGLRGFCELVAELGGDGAALLRRFDIAIESIDSDDALISADATGWALELAAAELACPDFGLRLAARQPAAVFGPLSVAVANAATVGDAIACAQRFLFIHHTGLSIGLIPDPDGQAGMIALNYRDIAEATGFCQGVDHGAGTVHRHLSRSTGGDYGLRTVHLPHPPRAPVDRYVEFFGADVRFDMPTTLFRFPIEQLAKPMAGRNPILHQLAMDYLDRNFPEVDRTMTARVRLAIDRAFAESKPDLDGVARTLSMHERSLQRALATEGTTFTAVLDEARRDVTYRLLCETDLPMSRITALIGLREQSALTRVVRRWYGATPQQIRTTARSRR